MATKTIEPLVNALDNMAALVRLWNEHEETDTGRFARWIINTLDDELNELVESGRASPSRRSSGEDTCNAYTIQLAIGQLAWRRGRSGSRGNHADLFEILLDGRQLFKGEFVGRSGFTSSAMRLSAQAKACDTARSGVTGDASVVNVNFGRTSFGAWLMSQERIERGSCRSGDYATNEELPDWRSKDRHNWDAKKTWKHDDAGLVRAIVSQMRSRKI